MESKLKVKLLNFTPKPIETMAMAAKLCYSASKIEDLEEKISSSDQENFVEMLIKTKHLSPIEHISFTFGIEGISRACSHQLVRHRLASYSQQSQRYVKADNFDYIIPPSIKEAGLTEEFEKDMMFLQKRYFFYNENLGNKGEKSNQDARFILPNAAETKLIFTMNARELLHFFAERTCNRAQWEIRTMAKKMLNLSYLIAPNIFKYAGPSCVAAGKCYQGQRGCGKLEEVKKEFEQYLK